MDGFGKVFGQLAGGEPCTGLRRARYSLFATWAEIAGHAGLESAVGHVDEYREWLIGQGFPKVIAQAHADVIRARWEAVR